MYTADPNIQDLKVKDRVISKLSFSMNAPQIATPEGRTEEARCYIMLFKSGTAYASYIGLYLPASDRRFFYANSGNPLAEDRLNEVMEESSQFAEEMGFLLDELKLTEMSAEERDRWIEEQPFFGYAQKKEEEPEEAPGARAEAEEGKPVEAAEAQHEEPGTQPLAPSGAAQTPPEPPASAGEQLPPSPGPSPDELAQETAPPAPMSDMALDPYVEAPFAEEPELPARPAKRSSARQKPAKTPPTPSVAAGTAEEALEDEMQTEEQRDTPARAQKRQKKGPQSSTGTVSKEYEALARLLASF